MEKILPISLNLNFPPNTLGCYRLSSVSLRYVEFSPENCRAAVLAAGGHAKYSSISRKCNLENSKDTRLLIAYREPMNPVSRCVIG